jgi:hypothetical protein
MSRAKALLEQRRRARAEAAKSNAPKLASQKMVDLLGRLGVQGTSRKGVAKQAIEEAFEQFQRVKDAFPSFGEQLGNVDGLLAAMKKLQRRLREMPMEERWAIVLTNRELASLKHGEKLPVETAVSGFVTVLNRRKELLKCRARGKPQGRVVLCQLMRELHGIWRQYRSDKSIEKLRACRNWICDAVIWAGVKCPSPKRPSDFDQLILPPRECV